MITTGNLYIYTVLEKIATGAYATVVLGAIIALVSAVLYVVFEADKDCVEGMELVMKSASKGIKGGLIAVLISVVPMVAVPSKKEMAMIYVLPKLEQNIDIGEVNKSILKIINRYLDEDNKKEVLNSEDAQKGE